jgi:hypothetical protein
MGVHPKTFTLADVSHDTINTDTVDIVTLGFFHFNFDNFSLHCRRVQVLELESVTRSAAHLLRAETLADDALKAEPGGVPEYEVPRLGDQIEGIEEEVSVISALPELPEDRQPVIVATHSLAIYQAGAQSERVYGLDDEREAARPVVAVAGEQVEAGSVAAGHQAIAIVLDLVNPVRPLGGRSPMDGRQGSMKGVNNNRRIIGIPGP